LYLFEKIGFLTDATHSNEQVRLNGRDNFVPATLKLRKTSFSRFIEVLHTFLKKCVRSVF